ncbi:reverse transcriptase domain-containing protein [Tanacetum coccineum]|uniref:Reverse transcriptase domain-containing protein n=1 Tax=Tanacetum coccineum TaxID=301880 RepID=A0ABQ4XZQ3_9ASTR
MPVWCKMFRQTLSGSARNWFDSLDPKSVDGFEELSSKFLEEFSLQKRYDKDPTKIHGIKRKPNKGLQAFMDRFKAESAHIKGVPPVLRIFAFMHGHDHPELAKKLNDQIPKIVDEMWERVRAFIKGETAGKTRQAIQKTEVIVGCGEGRSMRTCAPYARREGFTPLTKTPKEILAMDNVNFFLPPPMVGDYSSGLRKVGSSSERYQARRPKEQGLSQRKREGYQHGEISRIPKKPYERVEHWMDNAITFLSVPQYQLMNYPVVVEAMIEGFRLPDEVKAERISNTTGGILRRSQLPNVGVIDFGSLYGELRRMKIRSLGAVASTIHSMMKFPTSNEIATISTTRETLRECRQIEEAQYLSRHTRRPGKEPIQLDEMKEMRQLDKERRLPKSGVKEKIVVNDNYPEQLVTIGGGISPNTDDKEGRREDGFPYGRGSLLLHEDAFWSQECRGNITEAGQLCLQGADRGKPRSKCSFDMEEGKFLGYIVTSEGIRANPEKAKAVMAERSLPFLDTLKKCTNKRDFRWTEAPEAAFLEIKKLVYELPTLTTLKKGETLMMYLAAANKAVSEVLLIVRDGRKMPIHYVSRSLQGAKTNYALMEKLALALVYTARRLRRYFQAHPIKVITDSPIGQVLNKSGALGRLAKYAVELGAYGITYVPRVAIKGQVLADLLADTPTEIDATAEVANNPRVKDIPESSNAWGDLTPGPKAWRLYTDGASNNEGSGVGLILIAPDDVKYSYALHLNFSNSNNDVEYEALLAGLRIAKEMQVKDIHAFVDSKLVASQVEGSYEAKGERMIKYQEKVLELAGAFNRFRITHIPRAENRKADALSKLAAVQFDHLSKEVLVEVLNERSVEAQEVNMVVEEEGPTWMTPIRNYLEKGKLPEDPVDARTLMEKIGNYTMEDGVLYRKSYLVPLMRCVGPLQANYIIREVHMGSCGMHDGPRQVVAKAMNLGYYWPSMHRDARELIRACDDCQAHASVPRLPKADMISVTSAWPFMKWGMDIVGPLLEGPGRVKYLIVAIDYFTKWMEAKPLATITGKQVVNFTYDNIVCRFGIPATIIIDNGTQFGNGAVERANKSLLRGIKTRLEKGGSAWAEEVPNVLWAHRTMKKTSNGETPFSLTYGTEVVIPAEIGMPTHRTSSVNEKTNDQELRLNLDLLDERREIAAIREARYKQQVEKYYNKKVRHVQFKVGEFVLRRNEVSRAANTGKLGPTWEGPYKVIQAFQSGAYKLSNMEGEEIPRTWHACNLRRHMASDDEVECRTWVLVLKDAVAEEGWEEGVTLPGSSRAMSCKEL